VSSGPAGTTGPGVVAGDVGGAPGASAAVLAAEAVSVRLGRALVLDRIDLAVAPGEVVGLVGPNGSGKSTLLRTLFGAQRPLSGRVVLHGEPLGRWSRAGIARQVAVVAQEPPAELPLRVEEAVLLGRLPHRQSFARWTGEDREAAAEALAAVDIAHLVGRTVWSLSGGERQRVLIARALAQRTPIVLWDEPTNHLDLRHGHDGLALLRDRGLSGVVVLHDLNLAARYCDRLVVLDHGRVVAAGRPGEACDPHVVGRVFGVRADPVEHGEVTQFLFSRPAGPTAAEAGRA